MDSFTRVPNTMFDDMRVLTGAEYKIYMGVVRKLLGWQKTKDYISYSQIAEITGIKSHTTIQKSLGKLVEKGLVSVAYKIGTPTFIELLTPTKTEGVGTADPAKKWTATPPKTERGPLQKVDTQKKVKKVKKEEKKDLVLRTKDGRALTTVVMEAMKSKYGEFSNYPMQAKKAQHIVERAKALFPDNVEGFLKSILGCYWKQIRNGNKALRGKAFNPSTLDTEWIWNENYEAFRKAHTEPETVVKEQIF